MSGYYVPGQGIPPSPAGMGQVPGVGLVGGQGIINPEEEAPPRRVVNEDAIFFDPSEPPKVTFISVENSLSSVPNVTSENYVIGVEVNAWMNIPRLELQGLHFYDFVISPIEGAAGAGLHLQEQYFNRAITPDGIENAVIDWNSRTRKLTDEANLILAGDSDRFPENIPPAGDYSESIALALDTGQIHDIDTLRDQLNDIPTVKTFYPDILVPTINTSLASPSGGDDTLNPLDSGILATSAAGPPWLAHSLPPFRYVPGLSGGLQKRIDSALLKKISFESFPGMLEMIPFRLGAQVGFANQQVFNFQGSEGFNEYLRSMYTRLTFWSGPRPVVYRPVMQEIVKTHLKVKIETTITIPKVDSSIMGGMWRMVLKPFGNDGLVGQEIIYDFMLYDIIDDWMANNMSPPQFSFDYDLNKFQDHLIISNINNNFPISISVSEFYVNAAWFIDSEENEVYNKNFIGTYTLEKEDTVDIFGSQTAPHPFPVLPDHPHRYFRIDYSPAILTNAPSRVCDFVSTLMPDRSNTDFIRVPDITISARVNESSNILVTVTGLNQYRSHGGDFSAGNKIKIYRRHEFQDPKDAQMIFSINFSENSADFVSHTDTILASTILSGLMYVYDVYFIDYQGIIFRTAQTVCKYYKMREEYNNRVNFTISVSEGENQDTLRIHEQIIDTPAEQWNQGQIREQSRDVTEDENNPLVQEDIISALGIVTRYKISRENLSTGGVEVLLRNALASSNDGDILDHHFDVIPGESVRYIVELLAVPSVSFTPFSSVINNLTRDNGVTYQSKYIYQYWYGSTRTSFGYFPNDGDTEKNIYRNLMNSFTGIKRTYSVVRENEEIMLNPSLQSMSVRINISEKINFIDIMLGLHGNRTLRDVNFFIVWASVNNIYFPVTTVSPYSFGYDGIAKVAEKTMFGCLYPVNYGLSVVNLDGTMEALTPRFFTNEDGPIDNDLSNGAQVDYSEYTVLCEEENFMPNLLIKTTGDIL